MTTSQHFKYDNHEKEWRDAISDPERKKVADTWLENNSLDAWRHKRLRRHLEDIIRLDRDTTWLTVGDGRYGSDARYLISQEVKNVHCSDISDVLLELAHNYGLIRDYSAQNAEALEFDNDSFDYIYCKESFHHFPRPYIALHEMFRVARKAVILTEPRDRVIDHSSFGFVRTAIKKILRKDMSQHEFETVGNYVYTTSEREMEKFLLGMHYRYVAFKGVNDYYIKGIEFIPKNSKNPEHIRTFRKLKNYLRRVDWFNKLGLTKSALLTTILFKAEPAPDLLDTLKKAGWNVKKLPLNPYLSQE